MGGIEHAIHELYGFIIRKTPGQFEGFIDDDGRGGGRGKQFIRRKPQDIAVHNGHALETPVLEMAPDHIVDLGLALDRTANERLHEGIVAEPWGIFRIRIERFIEKMDAFVHRKMADIPLEQNL